MFYEFVSSRTIIALINVEFSAHSIKLNIQFGTADLLITMSDIPFKSHVSEQNFEFNSWNIHVQKSHILQSRCTNSPSCDSHSSTSTENFNLCDFCKYEKELELPQIPEMTFASNKLKLSHSKGFSIEFNALDALKLVDSKNDLMKVAVAEEWSESRLDPSIKDVVKPFDWTYTTDYKGSLSESNLVKISQTTERINIDKLKVKEKILFYEDIMLFEDELADNGTAQCSIKIRVMPDSFFILLRFFLRVDNMVVKIIDTRIYFEENTNHLLREQMTKEKKIKDLTVPQSLLRNPQELCSHLPTVKFEYEKIEF